MTSFLVALQFLTRIPIHLKKVSTEKEIAQSLLYYPVVGLLIGFLLFSVNVALFETSDLLRASIVLIIWVAITGALHLDGLADSADALVGGFGDKEKTLSIMKDPCCGPVGVVTLVLTLLLKFALIASLIEDTALLLILAPCFARTSVLWSFNTTPYVRKNGFGSAMEEYFPHQPARIVMILMVSGAVVLYGWVGVILTISILIILYYLKRIMMTRIGGMTGDTLGAQIEILEPSVLLIGALLLFIT